MTVSAYPPTFPSQREHAEYDAALTRLRHRTCVIAGRSRVEDARKRAYAPVLPAVKNHTEDGDTFLNVSLIWWRNREIPDWLTFTLFFRQANLKLRKRYYPVVPLQVP
jgi:hypothetical protein